MPAPRTSLSRRAFMKSAVAIGGASALAACIDRGGMPDVAQGPDDLSTLPTRQHAWNDALDHDKYGNAIPPRHQLLLFFDYAGDGAPTREDREQVDRTLRGLERAYVRSNEGLIFTVGYSPRYFGRFGAKPEGVDLPPPTALSSFEAPEFDTQDAVVHLASDHAQLVLAAEEALLGNQSSLNGVEMAASFDGVLTRVDRRSGFVGEGLPAQHQDVAGIPESKPVPEESPLYMGFKSGFTKNQASEDRVTIPAGPFAGGTTQHASRIQLQLDQWYEQDSREQRVAKMFCPAHAEKELVEGTGESLGDDSAMDACPDDVVEQAREKGVVGHSQKSARARKDDKPIILRRDFDSTDDGEAGLHFVAHQRTISDFVDTRTAMNGDDLSAEAGVGQKNNNGILQYMSVRRRGNWLLPPRERRALPEPN